MSPITFVIFVSVVALIGGVVVDHIVQRRRAARLEAAVRAQAIVESIPLRGVTVRGASRDRTLSGKARRRARRVVQVLDDGSS